MTLATTQRRARSTALRDLAQSKVVTTAPERPLTDCARLMRSEHVGSLVVVDHGRPVGVVTDRDIVVEAVAVALDPTTLTAGDIMSQPVASAHAEDDLIDALAAMREHGVRRLVILDEDDSLCGIVALDDLLATLAQQLTNVARVIEAEHAKEDALRSG